MRMAIIVILTIIVTSMLCAQIDPPLYAPEFYIHVKNATPNTTIHFTLEKISVGYCYDADIVPSQFVECDECLPYCSSCDGSTIEVEINSLGNNASTQEGWGFCAMELGTKDPPHYGFAVYKLTQVESQNYIYLDTRDIRYSRGLLLGGYDVDFIIRYDGSGDAQFEFDAYTDGTWTTIPMRGLQQIWRGDWDGDGDIDYSFPDVSLFPTDYWSNCLTVGYNYEYPNKVIWSKVPGSATITKYRLYKTITQNSEPPSENQFTFITETSSTEFYYDDIVDADENGNRVVHYFVKGYYQSAIESGWTQRTNIGSITISYSWQSALNIGTEDDHPRLVWYEHPNHPNANSFKVYRRINYGSWSIIQTTSNKFYVDQQFTVVNNPSNTVYYRVSAVDNGQETDYTNTVNIEVGKLPFKEIGEESIQVSKYELSQNYPNPFNPNTNISYSIPENAFVTLKIYDVLGNEVEVLINDQKEPGNYQIDFNASELSSGIYYYTLTAGNFTSTKKMSLIK